MITAKHTPRVDVYLPFSLADFFSKVEAGFRIYFILLQIFGYKLS